MWAFSYHDTLRCPASPPHSQCTHPRPARPSLLSARPASTRLATPVLASTLIKANRLTRVAHQAFLSDQQRCLHPHLRSHISARP
jgi:hypothetical protein